MSETALKIAPSFDNIVIDYHAALDLMDESRSIAALIAAALRTYDADSTTAPSAAAALIDSMTGILMLAKQHDRNAENILGV